MTNLVVLYYPLLSLAQHVINVTCKYHTILIILIKLKIAQVMLKHVFKKLSHVFLNLSLCNLFENARDLINRVHKSYRQEFELPGVSN